MGKDYNLIHKIAALKVECERLQDAIRSLDLMIIAIRHDNKVTKNLKEAIKELTHPDNQ